MTTTTTSTTTTSTSTTTTASTTTFPQDIDGLIGSDIFVFGSSGSLQQDIPITGLAGLGTFVFGSDGSVSFDQTITGIVGKTYLGIGTTASSVYVPPYPIDGVEGVDFLGIGSGGDLLINYNIVGRRGLGNLFRFGVGGSVEIEYGDVKEYKKPWTVNDTEVYFRQTVVGTRARYLAAQTIDLANGDPTMIAPWRMPRIPPSIDDRIITVGMGEAKRLDIIAMNVYGRGNSWMWPYIAYANDIMNPFEEPLAGDRIRIPSPSRVQSYLGVAGSGQELHRYRPVLG